MIDHEKLQKKILETIMEEMDKMEGEKMKPMTVKIEIEEEHGEDKLKKAMKGNPGKHKGNPGKHEY